MPAKSQAQQKMMGMALAMKKGEMPHSASKKAHEVMMGMNEKSLKEFAGTKRKGLPMKKRKKVATSDGYMMK